MNDFVYVPIPLELYKDILSYAPNNPHTLIYDVVESFLERQEDKSEIVQQNGIHWDKLFLPDGTKIRTKRFNSIFECEILDGQINWDGKLYNSVAQAINAMRGNTMNNAWLFAEIKRPSDISWILADNLRAKKR